MNMVNSDAKPIVLSLFAVVFQSAALIVLGSLSLTRQVGGSWSDFTECFILGAALFFVTISSVLSFSSAKVFRAISIVSGTACIFCNVLFIGFSAEKLWAIYGSIERHDEVLGRFNQVGGIYCLAGVLTVVATFLTFFVVLKAFRAGMQETSQSRR